VACIAGVGFTDSALATQVRLGVYAGSIFSAIAGLVVLSRVLPKTASHPSANTEDQTRQFILAEPKYEMCEQGKP